MPDAPPPDAALDRPVPPSRSGPLDATAPIRRAGLRVAVSPPLARLALRGGAEAARRCGAAFGVEIPILPCRAAVAGERAALWLGPDEWLLLAPADDPAAHALPEALAGTEGALVEIGHRQVGLDVVGPDAAEALNAGCPLDLDAHAFPTGACTRTLFGKAGIVLWRRAEQRFHLEVARSFASYVHALLERVAAEYPG